MIRIIMAEIYAERWETCMSSLKTGCHCVSHWAGYTFIACAVIGGMIFIPFFVAPTVMLTSDEQSLGMKFASYLLIGLGSLLFLAVWIWIFYQSCVKDDPQLTCFKYLKNGDEVVDCCVEICCCPCCWIISCKDVYNAKAEFQKRHNTGCTTSMSSPSQCRTENDITFHNISQINEAFDDNEIAVTCVPEGNTDVSNNDRRTTNSIREHRNRRPNDSGSQQKFESQDQGEMVRQPIPPSNKDNNTMHSPLDELEHCDTPRPSAGQGSLLRLTPPLLQEGATGFSKQFMTPEEQYHFTNILKLASEASAPAARYHIEGLIGVSSSDFDESSHQDIVDTRVEQGLPSYEDVMKECTTEAVIEKY